MRNTYSITPWCRVLPEQLTGLQLVKRFPAFHRTRRFITALTSVRHLSLSWANPIQSTCPHPTSWRSILILSTHLCLGLPSGLCTYSNGICHTRLLTACELSANINHCRVYSEKLLMMDRGMSETCRVLFQKQL